MSERADPTRYLLSAASNKPAQGSTGSGWTELTFEDSANSAFEWIPDADDSQSGPAPQKRRHKRIGHERLRYLRWIGSEIEHASCARGHFKQLGRGRTSDPHLQRVFILARIDFYQCLAGCGAQVTRIASFVDALETR